jgi:hypothetical protein
MKWSTSETAIGGWQHQRCSKRYGAALPLSNRFAVGRLIENFYLPRRTGAC